MFLTVMFVIILVLLMCVIIDYIYNNKSYCKKKIKFNEKVIVYSYYNDNYISIRDEEEDTLKNEKKIILF